MEYQILDHMTLCRFRNEIVDKKAYESLLKKINKALGRHQAIVKTGVIVDVSNYSRPPCSQGRSYLRNGGSEGRGEKVN
ncbi:MAG: hypothetical protein ACMUEL_01000 [Flavobacteriales bacterium Tduv]